MLEFEHCFADLGICQLETKTCFKNLVRVQPLVILLLPEHLWCTLVCLLLHRHSRFSPSSTYMGTSAANSDQSDHLFAFLSELHLLLNSWPFVENVVKNSCRCASVPCTVMLTQELNFKKLVAGVVRMYVEEGETLGCLCSNRYTNVHQIGPGNSKITNYWTQTRFFHGSIL